MNEHMNKCQIIRWTNDKYEPIIKLTNDQMNKWPNDQMDKWSD